MTKYRIFLLIFSLSFIFNQTNDGIATFYFIEGDCSVKNDNDPYYRKAIVGRQVYPGDVIKSKENSFCSINFKDKKSYIYLDKNTSVQILDNFLTREIQLNIGSIYFNNIHNDNKKTYIFTENSQIFVDHDRVWVETSYLKGDSFFSINQSMKIFNLKNNTNQEIPNGKLISMSNKGDFLESLQYSIIPEYVINDIPNSKHQKDRNHVAKSIYILKLRRC